MPAISAPSKAPGRGCRESRCPSRVLKEQPETADNAGLFAVVDMVVADDMAADVFLGPAVLASASSMVLTITLGAAARLSHWSQYLPRATPEHLELPMSLFSMIQPLLQWAETSPICPAVARRPIGGGVAQVEAADGDVVDARFLSE